MGTAATVETLTIPELEALPDVGPGKRLLWTAHELAVLRKYAQAKGCRAVAKFLGTRTAGAVRNKAYAIGMPALM